LGARRPQTHLNDAPKTSAFLFKNITTSAVATSCCISDVQVNGKAKIFTPHSYHIFQPILMKLGTKKDIRHTTPQAKFSWCGKTKKGSA